MADIKAPAVNPCGSCPYRRDVPSGVWAPEEYVKLPQYDGETFDQPPAVFLCHQQNGRLCAGWVACHDMGDNLGLRIASMSGRASREVVEAAMEYTTSTPLFATGAEAAAHGMAEVQTPSHGAQRVITKLEHKRARRDAR